jgi:hypothetical protein
MSLVEHELAGPPTPQTCGRCRVSFAGDPTLPQGLDLGWWACAPCRELLLGSGALAKPTWAPKARR